MLSTYNKMLDIWDLINQYSSKKYRARIQDINKLNPRLLWNTYKYNNPRFHQSKDQIKSNLKVIYHKIDSIKSQTT